MAETISHHELRNGSSDILRRVQAGETVHVTNHGEVVAVLSPPGQGMAPRGGRGSAARRVRYDPAYTVDGDVSSGAPTP